MDNSIPVYTVLRRVGAKGPTATLPLVPGLFPTVAFGDYSDLAGAPKKIQAWSNWAAAIPAGQMREWIIGGPTGWRLDRLYIQDTGGDVTWWMERTTYTYTNNVGWANVGNGDLTSMFSYFGVAPGLGTMQVSHGQVDFNPGWTFSPGSSLRIQNHGGIAPVTAAVGFQITELPEAPIEP
jgi:hypothetical protein